MPLFFPVTLAWQRVTEAWSSGSQGHRQQRRGGQGGGDMFLSAAFPVWVQGLLQAFPPLPIAPPDSAINLASCRWPTRGGNRKEMHTRLSRTELCALPLSLPILIITNLFLDYRCLDTCEAGIEGEFEWLRIVRYILKVFLNTFVTRRGEANK